MPTRGLLGVVTALVLAATLAACNLSKAASPTADVQTIYTAAAGTLISQFNDQQTQTAVSVQPTAMASFTPLPTFALGAGLTPFGTSFAVGTPSTPGTLAAGLTPLATAQPAGTGAFSFAVGCNDATLIKETVPDGKSVDGGAVFDKSWTFKNTGSCAWDEGYSFVFLSGERMQGVDIKIQQAADFVKPSYSAVLTVPLTPPRRAGEYKGYWQMKSDAGVLFGSKVWVDVVVR